MFIINSIIRFFSPPFVLIITSTITIYVYDYFHVDIYFKCFSLNSIAETILIIRVVCSVTHLNKLVLVERMSNA